MTKELIWVHKRHADYPTIQIGFRLVTQEIAAKMLADGCAQHKGTDNRRLHRTTAEVYKPVKAEAEATQEPASEPEPQATESVEVEAPKPRRRNYKRRDITAEK